MLTELAPTRATAINAKIVLCNIFRPRLYRRTSGKINRLPDKTFRSRVHLRAVSVERVLAECNDGKACRRSRRSIQKSRDAAAIINIAAKSNRDHGGIARHRVGPFRHGSSVKQPEALAHHGHRQVEHRCLITRPRTDLRTDLRTSTPVA